MEQIELQQIESGMLLRDALDVMRKSRRSAILTDGKEGAIVITVDEVVEYLRAKALRLSEVVPRNRIVDLSNEATASRSEHSLLRRATDASIANLGVEYVILSTSGHSGMIATAFKPLADALRKTISICICRQDPSHVWFARDLITPGKCPEDGNPVDCA